jgi:hypothetical protein
VDFLQESLKPKITFAIASEKRQPLKANGWRDCRTITVALQ